MDHLDEVARRGWVVVSRVGDAQPASRAQLPRFEREVGPELHEEVEHHAHRVLVRAETEDLRSDVGMKADQIEARVLQRFLDCPACGSGLDREAELRIQLTGRDVIVRVRLDPR